jgi:hypothetical protein
LKDKGITLTATSVSSDQKMSMFTNESEELRGQGLRYRSTIDLDVVLGREGSCRAETEVLCGGQSEKRSCEASTESAATTGADANVKMIQHFQTKKRRENSK